MMMGAHTQGNDNIMAWMPLKESIVVVTANETTQAFENQVEECKQSTTLCDDLEKLLETGYAELLRSDYEKYSEEEGEFVEILDESPFPKGIAVFDEDGSNDDEDLDKESSLPFSNAEDGYEVICAREVIYIPAFHVQEQQKTVIGQSA